MAVVQWGTALAVSYPARKYGIKRGSRAEEISKLAGANVTIVPVETISSMSNSSKTHSTDNDHASTTIVADANVTPPAHVPKGNQATEKVSLARYRTASARVFAAIATAVDAMGATIERASIDEAYIDVTNEVTRRVEKSTKPPSLSQDTLVVGDKLDMNAITDIRLAHGAAIASAIRKQVFVECSYTMSAGISVNKLLAKFASASNKPNKQTIVPLCAVSDLLRDVPLAKLRGLGGKLGKDVEAFGVTTAGEATKLTMAQLTNRLANKKTADFVYKCVRGVDETLVKPRDLPKTILAAKSFSPEKTLNVVQRTWMPVLAEELVDRLDEDSQLNDRQANTLTVTFRATAIGSNDWVTASRSVSMPAGSGQTRQVAIMKSAITLLHTVLVKDRQFDFPISLIGLTACNFVERASGKECITSFFEQRTNDDAGASDESRKPVGANGEEDHKKRLQEKADREFALRLHREQSVTRPGRKSVPTSSSHIRGIIKRKPNGTNALKGVVTVDKFFRRRD